MQAFVLLSLLSSLQPTPSAAVYTLVHRPGALVTWYEEGLWLQVPQNYAARQARYDVRTIFAPKLAPGHTAHGPITQPRYVVLLVR